MDFSGCADETNRDFLDKEMLKFTLSLYDNSLMSNEAVDFVVESFDNFLSNTFIPYLEYEVHKKLKSEISQNVHHKIQFILESNRKMFYKFSTHYNRLQQYQIKSMYTPPEIFCIGSVPDYILNDPENVYVGEKDMHAVHVPLKRSLELFFSNSAMFEEIRKYVDSLMEDKNVLRNIMQGDLWRTKYSNPNKIIYPLLPYFDEFETRNPLSSHSGEESIGGFYIKIGCMPPHLEGKVNNLFVSTLVYAKYLKYCSYEKVFKRTIEELDLLSKEGITVNINGCDTQIFFECPTILGDNKAINCICGFAASFSANYYCRFCRASKQICQIMSYEDTSLLRTPSNYKIDVMIDDPAKTGINFECPFNKIETFDICINNGVDKSHDVDEGILIDTMSKVLTYYVNKNAFTIDYLNYKIETFPYSDVEKSNKPRPVFFTQSKKGASKIKMKQSAAEALCLARYLGLMIGDMIPDDDRKHWKLYEKARKIIGILNSPSLTRPQISTLDFWIQKYNRSYVKLYGKLKPKMHIWLHYMRLTFLLGPLLHLSTMIFERENRRLKQIAVGTCSSLNLPLTLAVRHQLKMCYARECAVIDQTDIKLGTIDKKDVRFFFQSLVPQAHLPNNILIHTLKSISILGHDFKKCVVFVVKFNDIGPVFATVKTLFLYSNQVFVHAQVFDTIDFHGNYHAYWVNSTQDCVLIHAASIPKLPPCLYVNKTVRREGVVCNMELIATRYDL